MNDMVTEAKEAALTVGVHLRLVAVHAPDDLDRAFSTITGERADAILIFPSSMLYNQRKRIVELAEGHRLPIVAMGKELYNSVGSCPTERTLWTSIGAALPMWIRYSKARSLLTCRLNNPPSLNFSSISKLQRLLVKDFWYRDSTFAGRSRRRGDRMNALTSEFVTLTDLSPERADVRFPESC
ncbi:hypothetical protein ACVWYH_007724 [Bradyrhizobium sp. GM24.11]|jgi:hypothetical protein